MVIVPEQKVFIISVGGSLVIPNGEIDRNFLKKLNAFIRAKVKKGKKFFLVVGAEVLCVITAMQP